VSLIRVFLLGLAAQIAVSAVAVVQSTPTAGSQQPPLMEHQKEIALAFSACPPSVASKAGVYVLEKSGYVKVRDSRSGFTAIVQHSLPTSQEPQCMDEEGTRTFLPRVLKVAELRAQGKSPEEIKRFVADAFAKGVFPTPTRPGVIYMLSTENLVPNDKGSVATNIATQRVRAIPQSEALHVVERFTRVDENTINYDVVIEDPKVFTSSWKVAMPLHREPDYKLFEYACHEGNRAVPNTLSGGRAHDRTARVAKAQ